MREIPLTQGKVALVDDEDFEWLNQWRWYAKKAGSEHGRRWYARRKAWDENGKRLVIWMHRLLLSAPEDMETDHINHNGLDNRRSNLRICTNSQNQANKRKRPNCTSQYRGVSWAKHGQAWRAQIQIKGKVIHLGHFQDEVEAARAYDNAALEAYGEFANPNGV